MELGDKNGKWSSGGLFKEGAGFPLDPWQWFPSQKGLRGCSLAAVSTLPSNFLYHKCLQNTLFPPDLHPPKDYRQWRAPLQLSLSTLTALGQTGSYRASLTYPPTCLYYLPSSPLAAVTANASFIETIIYFREKKIK